MKIFIVEYNDGETEPYQFLLGAFSTLEKAKVAVEKYFVENAPAEEDTILENEHFNIFHLGIDDGSVHGVEAVYRE